MKKLREFINYGRPKGRGLKLHLGCGDYWFDGYINIDAGIYAGTDMICDVRQGLPFQPEVIQVVEAHDFLEHFNRDEVHNLLEEIKRVLISGGQILMTVPDMDGLIEQYQVNKENTIQQIYSISDHPSHKWGYTKETLKKLFEEHGFNAVSTEQVMFEHRPGEPKLEVQAFK